MADRATSRDRLFFGLVVFEMVASLVLGAITIGQRSFWLDESVSGTLARAGFREVLENFLVTDATMSIYNTMLVVWRQFGTGDAFIRSLSLLCVAGTVPYVALVGRRLFGRTTGLVAGGIVSLSPIAVRYAQEARAYGVVLLLLTLSSYCLLRALDSGSTARWFTYAIVAAAACYAHNFALFVIVANVVVVALGPTPTVNRRSIAEAAGVFVLLLLPLGLATIEHGAAQIAWVEDPSLQKVKVELVELAGSRSLAVIVGVLCLGTIVFGWRAWRVRRRLVDAWPYAFVTAWWSTPIIGALVVSVLSTPIFVSRYLIVALPGLALAAAAFVVRLPRPIGVVVLGFVVVASAFGIAHQYDRPNQDFRGAEAYIASAVGPDDGIVMCPYLDWTPFAYYAASEPSARMPTPLDGIWPFSEMFGRGRQIGPRPKSDAVAGSIWVVSRASGLDETQRRNTCGMNHLLKQRVRTERIRFDEVTVERWAPND